MAIFSSTEILQRLRKLADVATNKELAGLLEVNDKTLSGWNNRNSLPIDVIIKAAEKYDVDLHWLITGKEKAPALDEMECELLSRFKRLDFSQKLQVFNTLGNSGNDGSGINQSNNQGGMNAAIAGNLVIKN